MIGVSGQQSPSGNVLRAISFLCGSLLILTALALPCEAQEPILSTEPVWSSGVETNRTWSTAFGDVDGDGDLDLVCGNNNQINKLYLNNGNVFSTSPDWKSIQTNLTWSVALGDVDGDGDLDLVCGNYGQGNTLYLNVNNMLFTWPEWSSSAPHNFTTSVALGDVDGDGDLDLVCGNYNQSNTLYLNEGGAFADTTAWSSDLARSTYSVALGDVNGDGYLDLVCGNYGERNTIYLNEGGTLSTTPASLALTRLTYSVALGDVDGDGDLDLVCGNNAQSNTLYLNELNEGGTFSAAWSSDQSNNTTSVTLGDVDGDGDLDLACGNKGQSNTLYLNEGGTFSTIPNWSSVPPNSTENVALGDADADGDLDLACGNDSQINTLYLNNGGMLSTLSAWSPSLPINHTRSVALGDVDGDGDLDLACGNIGSPWLWETNTLYLNEGSMFSTGPAWSSSGPHHSTTSIALGDVDGDGYLDLACGNGSSTQNFSEINTLYINEGSVFSTTPVWSSDSVYITSSVALGDVDGDGDLDLACGNLGSIYAPFGHSNTLYLNDGNMLSTTPAWSSETKNHTVSVALGDVDRDGDLDIVCGNENEINTMYLYEGSAFSTRPDWLSSPPNNTYSVTLGDVDGDGDIDLVCGNSGQSNTLYLNEEGMFSTSPVWTSSPTNFTYSVALGDMDGDGDLDLVCGNRNQSNTLYLNEEGMFSTSSVWSSHPTEFTTSVALGDVDGDGDLDIACGNAEDFNTLYLGKRNPVFRGDPLSPTNHLPNNSAHLRFVRVKQSGTNLYCIQFTAIDVESDPIWILPEYQYEGEPTWYPAEIGGQSGAIGPFLTSPGGVVDSLEWNVIKLPFDSRDIALRLKTVSTPQRVSIIQHAASYLKEVGPVLPIRPVITPSTNTLTFPTVTVGDTVSVDLIVSNTGNARLTVSNILLPSNEMRISNTAFSLGPGQMVIQTVSLEPRHELDISGDLLLYSDDPIRPTRAVHVTTDIRALGIASRLLSPAEEIPLGEAVTVIVTPAPEVRVEHGFLYHRLGGSESFQDSIPLSRSASDFIGVIPGEAVKEAGLEYYIKVENSGIFSTDPPGAPDNSVFTQAVEAPAEISSFPRSNSGSGFLENRPIRIEVFLPVGTIFVDGLLHYRTGGEEAYRTQNLLLEEPIIAASIPDSLTGPRGLEYWVEVNTLTRTLTDPPNNPNQSPHTIRITVQNIQEDDASPAFKYRMVSIPLLFSEDFTGTLEALLSDQKEFGPYDTINWRSFRYIPDSLRYAELSEEWAAEHFRPQPGKGFWLISSEPNRITTAPITSYSTPTDSMCEVVLQPGWNQIGNPFCFPVAWDSIMVDTLTMAEVDSIEPPWAWVIGRGYQDSVEVLEPFEGYFVKNLSHSDVVLSIPPEESPYTTISILPEAIAGTSEESEVDDGWELEIRASSAGARDWYNRVGMRQGASNGWDPYDRSEPPMSPGHSVSLHFPHASWDMNPGSYSVDIRGEYEPLKPSQLKLSPVTEELWGHMWYFDVAKNFSEERAGDEVSLAFLGIEDLPTGAAVYLVDQHLANFIDIRKESSYHFFLGKRDLISTEEDTRFVLLVGSEDFIDEQREQLPQFPTVTALYQNYPNPFNPSTIIRYDIATSSTVELRIYDARGALVKTLYQGHRKPGRYEVGWNGENERGIKVASGIYFYRLQTENFMQTRKLVLLR